MTDKPTFDEYRIAITQHIENMKEVTEAFRDKLELHGTNQALMERDIKHIEKEIGHLDGAITLLNETFKTYAVKIDKEITELKLTKATIIGYAGGISLAVTAIVWIVGLIFKIKI